MSVRIAIHGATGKLGRLIIEESGDNYAGPVLRDGSIPECEVVIDVSSASGTAALLPRLSGQALLIGTTGDLPMDAIKNYAKNAKVALVANFSVGIPAMIDVLKTLTPMLPDGWDIEIVEAHHNQKKDAPSGTAKRLNQAVESITQTAVPIHSLRIGDTFGEHTVYLSGPGERLEIRHVATQRRVFAVGALRWAERLMHRRVGLYTE